jgi:hypothetical protein
MAIGVNGSGDYAKRVASPNFTMTGNTDKCTIAGWMKIRDITPGNWSYPFCLESSDVLSAFQAEIGIRDTDVQEAYAAGTTPHDWSPAPSENTWYYFYIKGANDGGGNIAWQMGYYTAAGGTPVDSYAFSAVAEWDIVRISLGEDSWSEWLNSCLSMVRVWTGVELSDPELRAERDSYFAKKTSGLWADWRLENNTDTADDSGNNRTLTFGGTLTSESDPELETVIGLDTA